MKKNILLLMLVLTFSTYECRANCSPKNATKAAEQDYIKETRNVNDFNAVTIIGNYDIIYAQGNACKVEVEAPRNIIEKVTTIVKDGTLTISPKKIAGVKVISNTNNAGNVTIKVTSPTLTKAVLMGNGDFVAGNIIKGKNLQVTLLGSGDMVFQNINYNNVSVTINGSGDILLSQVAATKSANIILNGSGDINIGQLSTANASVSLNGSGDMNIKNLDSQIANIKSNGSGDLKSSAIKAQQVIVNMHGSGDTSIHLIQCEHLSCKTICSGKMTISGTTNTYMKSETSRGTIRDSKLKYNKLLKDKTNPQQQTSDTPFSPYQIESRP